MAAPRATQFLALRNLSRTTARRHLHMTGPATYASPVVVPRNINGLRTERKNRNLITTGTKQDLIDRTTTTRNFTTNDDTIDSAHLPPTPTAETEQPLLLRVPILPTTTPSQKAEAEEEEEAVVTMMKPEISTMAADAVYLPMTDVEEEVGEVFGGEGRGKVV